MQDSKGVKLFDDWVEATRQIPNQGFEWACEHLTRENVNLPIACGEGFLTLGHWIMWKTACTATIQLLVQTLGVNPSNVLVGVVDKCVMRDFDHQYWSFLLDYCDPKEDPMSFAYTHDGVSPFFWTPLGRAIRKANTRTVRFFIEYGCRLPLSEELPYWAWDIQHDTLDRKAACTQVIVALLGVGRRQRCWRDLSRVFAKEVWKSRYHCKWTRGALVVANGKQ